jgi:glycerol-3-phosphate acyltransferase PlsY
MPVVILIVTALWIAVFYGSRYVSLASILAAIALPITAYLLHEPLPVFCLALLIALFVVFRHRANIGRLLNGTENKFTKKTAAPK